MFEDKLVYIYSLPFLSVMADSEPGRIMVSLHTTRSLSDNILLSGDKVYPPAEDHNSLGYNTLEHTHTY